MANQLYLLLAMFLKMLVGLRRLDIALAPMIQLDRICTLNAYVLSIRIVGLVKMRDTYAAVVALGTPPSFSTSAWSLLPRRVFLLNTIPRKSDEVPGCYAHLHNVAIDSSSPRRFFYPANCSLLGADDGVTIKGCCHVVHDVVGPLVVNHLIWTSCDWLFQRELVFAFRFGKERWRMRKGRATRHQARISHVTEPSVCLCHCQCIAGELFCRTLVTISLQ